MGGHAGGGTASRLAVDTIRAAVARTQVEDPETFGAEDAEDTRVPDLLRAGGRGGLLRHLRDRAGRPRARGDGHDGHRRPRHRPDRVRGSRRRQPLLPAAGRADLPGLRGPLPRQRAAQGRRDQRRRGEAQPVQEHHHALGGLRAAGGRSTSWASSSRAATPSSSAATGSSNLVDDPEILSIVEESPIELAPARLVALANDARRRRQHHRDRRPRRGGVTRRPPRVLRARTRVGCGLS